MHTVVQSNAASGLSQTEAEVASFLAIGKWEAWVRTVCRLQIVCRGLSAVCSLSVTLSPISSIFNRVFPICSVPRSQTTYFATTDQLIFKQSTLSLWHSFPEMRVFNCWSLPCQNTVMACHGRSPHEIRGVLGWEFVRRAQTIQNHYHLRGLEEGRKAWPPCDFAHLWILLGVTDADTLLRVDRPCPAFLCWPPHICTVLLLPLGVSTCLRLCYHLSRQTDAILAKNTQQ